MYKTAEEARHYYELAGFQKEALSPELKERAAAEAQRRVDHLQKARDWHQGRMEKYERAGDSRGAGTAWKNREKTDRVMARRRAQARLFSDNLRPGDTPTGRNPRARPGAYGSVRLAKSVEKHEGLPRAQVAPKVEQAASHAAPKIKVPPAQKVEQAASHAAPKVEQAAAKGMSNLGKGGLIAGGLGLAAAGAYGVHRYRNRSQG